MKIAVKHIAKPNPDLSYIVTYSILQDNNTPEAEDLELRVESGQSAKALLQQKLAAYEATISAIDIEVGEEI